MLLLIVFGTALLTHSRLVESAVQLTSDIPSSNGFICPLLTFNCIAIDLPSDTFRWNFNDVLVGSYPFQEGTEYPLDVLSMPLRSDVMIQIVNASSDQGLFNYNATLTVNSSSLIQEGVSITCGSLNTRSNAIMIASNMMIRDPPPPTSSANCFVTGVPMVSFQWSPSFTSQHAVERYRVAVIPDPSSCFSDQVSPSENYTCSRLVLGTHYSFAVSAINCGNQEGTRETFTLQPQVPQVSSDVTFLRYDQNRQLSQLTVQWNYEPLSVSERCSHNEGLDYNTVVLENSLWERVDQKVVSSNNCTAGLCSTSFSISSSDQYYLVSVSVTNAFGSSNITISDIINGSLPSEFTPSFNFENCFIFFFCSGECIIRYGQDPSYQDLGPPIQVPLNSPYPLPFMEATTTYYYQVIINSSLIIQLRGNFTTGEFDARLTTTNQVLLVVGVILWSVASIVNVIMLVVNGVTGIGLLSCYVVWCFLALSSLVSWVVVGVQVGLQTNTCAPDWVSTRDSLIISSFVFSVFTFLEGVVGHIFCPLSILTQIMKILYNRVKEISQPSTN